MMTSQRWSKGERSVRKSPNIVRVIGNEAVHPGMLDLRDDQMISHPKVVTGLYEKLPESKREPENLRSVFIPTHPSSKVRFP